jgi:hypothetical protein
VAQRAREARDHGRRTGKTAPRLRASVSDAFRARGFQPSGLTFPATGCWRVPGRVGRATLTFVVKIVRI